MGKFNKLIKAIIAITKNPALLNLVLDHNDRWASNVNASYGMSRGLPMVDFIDVCGSNVQSLNVYSFLDGGSLITDIALLRSLALRFEDCRYFEIGTWRGESVANLSEVCTSCHTLNLSRENIIALGLPESYADQHALFSKSLSNVVHLTGNSQTFDFGGLEQKFDLVFIDGDHSYEAVKHDTQQVFEHLIHDKSVVVWHDYGFSPEKVRFEVMAAILDGIPSQFRQHLYHVSNTKCALFIREKYETGSLQFPVFPDKVFSVKISPRLFRENDLQ